MLVKCDLLLLYRYRYRYCLNCFTSAIAGTVVPWCRLTVTAPVSVSVAVESTAIVICIVWNPAVIAAVPVAVAPVSN